MKEIKVKSVRSQVLKRKEVVLCFGIILGVMVTTVSLSINYHKTVATLEHNYIRHEKQLFKEAQKRIEFVFRMIYQNARIISLLPGVRNIEGENLREGESSAVSLGRFDKEDKNTVQQIYNNLKDNVNVSEVYCVIDGFSFTKEKETPFFMYDELILRTKTGFVRRQDVDNDDMPLEIEDEEYQWFEDNLSIIKANHPTFQFSTIHDIPAYISHEHRTCDNTQYISKSQGDVKNTHGFIMAVPFYNYAEQFRGVIAVIFRTNMLEAALLNVPLISITKSDKGNLKGEGLSLPDNFGRFILINEKLNIRIFDRRAKNLLSKYQKVINANKVKDAHKVKNDKVYFEKGLQIPFGGDWKLFYLMDEKEMANIRESNFMMMIVFSIGVIIIGFFSIGWIWKGAKTRKYTQNKAKELMALNQQLRANEQQLRASNQQLIANEVALRHAKEQAEVSAKAKGDFLANLSHEIRTPMNAVLGFSNLLQTASLNETQRKYLDTIISSGKLLLNLINNILDFSKLESNKVELESIDFNLEYLINDVFKMMTEKLEKARIHVYIDISESVPQNLRGDPTRLRQILINLLNNAIKFASKGEIGVLVSVEEFPKSEAVGEASLFLRFNVKDSGMGIPKDKQEVIFESFSQADTSTTRKFGGTGLGLAICSKLTKVMGGKIWVESEEGKGSEFIFIVQVEKGEIIVDKEIYPLSIKELCNKKVMIVDGNLKEKETLRKYCQDAGMEVLAVENFGQSALQTIGDLQKQNRVPEIILADIMLPDMYGYEFVKKIRVNGVFQSVKIIAMTSEAHIGIALRSHDEGFDGFFPKPISQNELINVIAAVLGDKRENGPIITRHMAEELSCKGMKILVVEDCIPNQMLVQAFFDELGCQGDYANNGKEAIEKLKSGGHDQYNLCLMDLQMPEMGGLEATKIIRKEITKDFPIIALTAAAMKSDVQKCLDVGINDYLTKPIDIEKLRMTILKWGKQT